MPHNLTIYLKKLTSCFPFRITITGLQRSCCTVPTQTGDSTTCTSVPPGTQITWQWRDRRHHCHRASYWLNGRTAATLTSSYFALRTQRDGTTHEDSSSTEQHYYQHPITSHFYYFLIFSTTVAVPHPPPPSSWKSLLKHIQIIIRDTLTLKFAYSIHACSCMTPFPPSLLPLPCCSCYLVIVMNLT